MTARLPRKIPAALRFAPELSRLDAWGWLEELCASRAELSTLCVLHSDNGLFLDFSLGDRKFSDVPARVLRAEKDGDGFYRAEVVFTDEVVKRELAAAILRLLSAAA